MESHAEDLLLVLLMAHIDATWLAEIVLFLAYAPH